ncbi:hypothetical protein HY478_03240 [Candidatus Uhrbacteria bacterium]|nr:hypothetical protein [Candidatus Uhrbacteria bacterium]
MNFTFGYGAAGFDLSDRGYGLTGSGGRLVHVPITNIETLGALREFLEACRDSLEKNLTALLATVVGPVRVLPKDDGLDRASLIDKSRDGYGGILGIRGFNCSIGEFFDAYAREVAHRRAAQPAGS